MTCMAAICRKKYKSRRHLRKISFIFYFHILTFKVSHFKSKKCRKEFSIDNTFPKVFGKIYYCSLTDLNIR